MGEVEGEQEGEESTEMLPRAVTEGVAVVVCVALAPEGEMESVPLVVLEIIGVGWGVAELFPSEAVGDREGEAVGDTVAQLLSAAVEEGGELGEAGALPVADAHAVGLPLPAPPAVRLPEAHCEALPVTLAESGPVALRQGVPVVQGEALVLPVAPGVRVALLQAEAVPLAMLPLPVALWQGVLLLLSAPPGLEVGECETAGVSESVGQGEAEPERAALNEALLQEEGLRVVPALPDTDAQLVELREMAGEALPVRDALAQALVLPLPLPLPPMLPLPVVLELPELQTLALRLRVPVAQAEAVPQTLGL